MPYTGKAPTESSSIWVYHTAPGLEHFQSDGRSGKWCIVVEPEDIDDAWVRICALLDASEILIAKASTQAAMKFSRFTTHLICVYNLDWSDKAEIARVRRVLFDAGVKTTMGYKRDIDTMAPEPGLPEFIHQDSDFLD